MSKKEEEEEEGIRKIESVLRTNNIRTKGQLMVHGMRNTMAIIPPTHPQTWILKRSPSKPREVVLEWTNLNIGFIYMSRRIEPRGKILVYHCNLLSNT